MTDEDPHSDLVALILVFVAAVLLGIVVWLLLRKYRMDQLKSFECTPPKLASPLPSSPWDSSLLLGSDQVQEQPSLHASAQEPSGSTSKQTSTAADTRQADQWKLEAEDKSKADGRIHKQQSGPKGLRDSKGAAKRPTKTKNKEAGRKRSRRSSVAVQEKSITASTKRRSKYHRPEALSPEVFKTAQSIRQSEVASLSPPHKGSAKERVAVVSASTTAAATPAAPFPAICSSSVRRSPAADAENVAQDQPRKTSPGEALSPFSAYESEHQATTSPEPSP